MPTTAGSVMLRAANHLNDPNQLMFTNTVLLPFLNMALESLEEELGKHEISAFKKVSITIDVDAEDNQLTNLPVDFIEPISLHERNRDSSEDWVEVDEKAEIDSNLIVRPSTQIIQWSRRNIGVYINPPSQDREVLLYYIAGITPALVAGTVIDIEGARRFLALDTARQASRDLGNSPTKSLSLEKDTDKALNNVITRLQKGDQGSLGTRRKAYRGR